MTLKDLLTQIHCTRNLADNQQKLLLCDDLLKLIKCRKPTAKIRH